MNCSYKPPVQKHHILWQKMQKSKLNASDVIYKLIFNVKYFPKYLNYFHVDRLRAFIAYEYRISISKN